MKNIDELNEHLDTVRHFSMGSGTFYNFIDSVMNNIRELTDRLKKNKTDIYRKKIEDIIDHNVIVNGKDFQNLISYIENARIIAKTLQLYSKSSLSDELESALRDLPKLYDYLEKRK